MTSPLAELNSELVKTLPDIKELLKVAEHIRSVSSKHTEAAHVSIALCTNQPTVWTSPDGVTQKTTEIIRSRLVGQDANVAYELLRPLKDDTTIQCVFDNKDPTLYLDFDKKQPQDWDTRFSETVKSWVAIPLFWFDEPVGLVTFDHSQPGKFTTLERDRDELKKYATLCATAIHNRLSARNIDALQATMRAIGPQYTVSDILHTAAKTLFNYLDCRRCAIFQRVEEGTHTFLRAGADERGPCADARLYFDEGEGLAGWALKYKTNRSVPNLEDPKRAQGFKNLHAESAKYRSMLVVPIEVGNAIQGVICVDDKKYCNFSNYDLQLVTLVACHLSAVIGRTAAQDTLINAVYKISKTASQTDERGTQQVFDQIVESVCTLIDPHPSLCQLGLIEQTDNDPVIAFKAMFPHERRDAAIKAFTQASDKAGGQIPGIVGDVVRTKKERMYNDIGIMDESLKEKYVPCMENMHSGLAVPILGASGDEVVGVINIEHVNADVFTDTHQLMVRALAQQVALVIKGQMLANSMKLRQNQLQNLITTSQALMSAESNQFKFVARSQLKQTCKSIGATKSVLVRMERQGKKELSGEAGEKGDGSLLAEAKRDKTDNPGTLEVMEKIACDYRDEGQFDIRSDDISSRVFEQRIPECFDDTKPNENVNQILKALGDIRSAICLPLDIGNRVSGVMWLLYKERRLPKLDHDILSAYANKYGLALQNYANKLKASEAEEKAAILEGNLSGLDKEFTRDYDNARRQQKVYFAASVGCGLGGFGTMMYAAYYSSGILGSAITSIAGMITMVIGILIFQRADKANRRSDNYHHEQLQFRQLRSLFNLASSLLDPELRGRLQKQCLRGALRQWFVSTTPMGEDQATITSDKVGKQSLRYEESILESGKAYLSPSDRTSEAGDSGGLQDQARLAGMK